MKNGISKEELDSFINYIDAFRNLVENRNIDEQGNIKAPKLEILFLLEIAEGFALAARESDIPFAEKVIEADVKTKAKAGRSKAQSH